MSVIAGRLSSEKQKEDLFAKPHEVQERYNNMCFEGVDMVALSERFFSKEIMAHGFLSSSFLISFQLA